MFLHARFRACDDVCILARALDWTIFTVKYKKHGNVACPVLACSVNVWNTVSRWEYEGGSRAGARSGVPVLLRQVPVVAGDSTAEMARPAKNGGGGRSRTGTTATAT